LCRSRGGTGFVSLAHPSEVLSNVFEEWTQFSGFPPARILILLCYLEL
jgi:hypothetical protein